MSTFILEGPHSVRPNFSTELQQFGPVQIIELMCNFFFFFSHERKKKYWEQLELRCRHLYRRPPPPHGLGNHGNHINSSMLVTPGSQCGYCTTTTGKEFDEIHMNTRKDIGGFSWQFLYEFDAREHFFCNLLFECRYKQLVDIRRHHDPFCQTGQDSCKPVLFR